MISSFLEACGASSDDALAAESEQCPCGTLIAHIVVLDACEGIERSEPSAITRDEARTLNFAKLPELPRKQ
jgi:hypothetical protein